MKQAVAIGIFLLSLLTTLRSASVNAGGAAGEEIQPLITTSELVVGVNRFAFGLIKAGKLLEGADVTLRLYALENGEAKLAISRFLIRRSKTSNRNVRSIAMRMEHNIHMGKTQTFQGYTLRPQLYQGR